MGTSRNKAPGKVAAELSAVNKRKLYEEIITQIGNLIDTGRLRPGDRLPPERELAEIFKVSRHSVREAIRSLEQRKVLASRRGSGTFVVQSQAQTPEEFLAQVVSRRKSKLKEIFQFRRLIEPEIAYLAALNATPKDIKRFESLLKQQGEKQASQVEYMQLDNTFHLALARAAKNSILLETVERINGVLSECRHSAYQSEERCRRSTQGHRRVLAAIKKGDPKSARQAMGDHLKGIEQIIFKPGRVSSPGLHSNGKENRNKTG